MKIYIQTDIEGIAGYVFFENRKDKSIENHEHRMRMKKLLTNEVNAAVKASFDAGASYVVINDNHGCAYEKLDPRCEILHGRANSGLHCLTDLDSSFDAMVLIGMHAMAGEENAVCPHSKWTVNNGAIYLSEASMSAAIAGDKGVSTVFISGDQTITKEVKEKIPKINIGVVKHGIINRKKIDGFQYPSIGYQGNHGKIEGKRKSRR